MGRHNQEIQYEIAIFGTGNLASGFAVLFTKAGHNITLASRDSVKAQTVAAKLGTGIGVSSLADAAGAADAVVLAVPHEAAANVVGAAGDLAGKIIIDITNPLTADFSSLTIGYTTSGNPEASAGRPGGEGFQYRLRLRASEQRQGVRKADNGLCRG